jgi:hypothetical protein
MKKDEDAEGSNKEAVPEVEDDSPPRLASIITAPDHEGRPRTSRSITSSSTRAYTAEHFDVEQEMA